MNLQNADLREAEFHDASFLGADLRAADLRGAKGGGANFRSADMTGANLSGASLRGASFSEARVRRVDLNRADLWGATFVRAHLHETSLNEANLTEVNFSHARLMGCQVLGANLTGATLVETVVEKSRLNGSTVYGVSAWNLTLNEVEQQNLVITPKRESAVTLDDLRLAQFVYLLLNNQSLRQVIDTITSKAVLILGRFSDERKDVLDAIRDELRRIHIVPMLFDFDKPASKDVTGTVETLARMARFIIVDLTDPSSVPHELATLVPFLRTTPVLPLRLAGSGGYSMFEDLQRAYSWVLKVQEYQDSASLVSALAELIVPADRMAEELRR